MALAALHFYPDARTAAAAVIIDWGRWAGASVGAISQSARGLVSWELTESLKNVICASNA